MPHRQVLKSRAVENLRGVFDCAAKLKRIFPKDRPFWGPEWTKPLINVRCRISLGQLEISANTRVRFLQVKVKKQIGMSLILRIGLRTT